MRKAAEAERLRMRQQLIAEGRHEPLWPAPYCEDSLEAALGFTYKLRTWNEANKKIEPIKPKDYLNWLAWHWYDTRGKGQPLAVWKPRRVLVSWFFRGLELWDGGLAMSSTQIGAQTYQGVAGSESFIWRVQFMYHQLRTEYPGWNLHTCKPDYSPLVREIRSLILPNGSLYQAINAEGESFRGAGTTRAVAEELSSYRAVNAVWGQMNIVCQGAPGKIGGHAVGIANTSSNPEWLKLKAKSYELPDWITPPPHCRAWETADGIRVLDLDYRADPEKDAAWVAKTKIGIPPDEWAREMEKDETIEDGIPVFSGYDDEYHCPLRFRREPIPLIPGSFLFGSWDCGQTLVPAFVLQQVTPDQKQVHALLEVVSSGDESMMEFAPRVLEELLLICPNQIDEILHFGDATVTQRSGSRKESARDVARQFGFNIKPVSNVFEVRRSAGAWVLARQLDDNKPGFIIDGTRCPILRMALQGKYKYQLSASGDSSGPGAVVREPLKNSFSHVAEAWAYGDAAIKQTIFGGGRVRRAQTAVKTRSSRSSNDLPW